MSKFNKIEYNTLYNKNNRKPFLFGMRKDENELFIAYCTKINIKPSTYLKNLVNIDAINRGYEPIFIDGRTGETFGLSTNTQTEVDKNV